MNKIYDGTGYGPYRTKGIESKVELGEIGHLLEANFGNGVLNALQNDLRVYNQQGQLINILNEKGAYDISNYSNGIYYVVTSNNKNRQYDKYIKTH